MNVSAALQTTALITALVPLVVVIVAAAVVFSPRVAVPRAAPAPVFVDARTCARARLRGRCRLRARESFREHHHLDSLGLVIPRSESRAELSDLGAAPRVETRLQL
jgi:hypothetical protein